MSEYDLLASWFRVADWVAYDLMKEGAEAIVIKPLGAHSKAATVLARRAFSSFDFRHRKLAASLAGWIQDPPLDLLMDFLQQEAERDRLLPESDLARLETQSVVEDIVFSAAFWARREHSQGAAFQLLRGVVERTSAGEYWNTSSYAMTTLCHHRVPGYVELLEQFRRFAFNAKVHHPSRPSLRQEQEFARNLEAMNPKTLQAIESALDQKEAAASAHLDDNSRTTVDELLSSVKRFEEAAV